MTAGRRVALGAAVLAAPVAWAAQLVTGYTLEEGGCSPGDARVAGASVDGVALGVSVVTALVALSGNVEWMCVPRMDGPSIFGALVDRDAGSFKVAPMGQRVPIGRR